MRTRRRRLTNSVHVLPTLVTLGNFLCGLGAITYALQACSVAGGAESAEGRYLLYIAGMLIIVGMIFDTLDGRIARMTRSESAFGAEMDSLADVVTFGVAPAVLVKALIMNTGFPSRSGWILVASFAVFAALRLARYNVEKSSVPTTRFFGLPSPAAAGAVTSVVLLYLAFQGQTDISELAVARYSGHILMALPVYTLLIGVLMVTRIRYPHVGRLVLFGRKPFAHLVALLLLVAMLGINFEVTLAAIFTIYVFAGLVLHALRSPEKRTAFDEAEAESDEPEPALQRVQR